MSNDRIEELKELLKTEADSEELPQTLERIGKIAMLAEQAILIVSVPHDIVPGEPCENCGETHEDGSGSHALALTATKISPSFLHEATQALVDRSMELDPLSALLGSNPMGGMIAMLAGLSGRKRGPGPEEAPGVLDQPPVDPTKDFPAASTNGD